MHHAEPCVGQLEEVQGGVDVALEAACRLAAALARAQGQLAGTVPGGARLGLCRGQPRAAVLTGGEQVASRLESCQRLLDRAVAAPHPGQEVEALLHLAEPGLVEADRVGVAAGGGAELPEAVEQVGGLRGEVVEHRVDAGQRRRRVDRRREQVGGPGDLLVTCGGAAELVDAALSAAALRRRSRSAASCSSSPADESSGAEVGDQLARRLHLRRAGRLAAAHLVQRRLGGSPLGDRLAHLVAQRGRARGQVEQVALAASLQQPLAGSLEGDLGEHLPHLAQHRLGHQRRR